MKEMSTSRDKRPFCPDFEEDMENDELKKLVKRLKGDSEKETLTNILEWQDRNIQFWWERWPLVPIFLILILVLIALLSLPLFSPIFRLLMAVILVMIIISMMVYLYIRHGLFLGEKTVKEKISKFKEVVHDTFRLSLPVDKILEYNLAVCRDYAKLTASLLFRAYPDSELYFMFVKIPIIKIPIHVAAAIKIKNKCYIMDQQLPILTINDWLIMQNKKKACISKLERDSKGRQKVTPGKQKTIIIEPKKVPKINSEQLTEEIAEIFGIEPTSHINEPDLEIRLHNYEDDEITKYSLIRAIKNRLEREFCDNTDKMSKINISQDKISVKIKET